MASKSNSLGYSVLSSEEDEDLPINRGPSPNHLDQIDSARPVPHGGGIDRTYGTTLNVPANLLSNEEEELRRKSSRSVTKKGLSNLTNTNIDRKDWPFLTDIFTTFLDAKWRWLLLMFVCTYFGTWLIFALAWYLILYTHGDFEPLNIIKPTWVPCITKVTDFTSIFLFSVETQQTTGYGYYHLTEECPAAVITLCLQSIVGVIVEGLMVGLVFLKMARAKKRTATLRFSRVAVISRRDGELCLMFRVADIRNKSHLLQARVRAQLITRRVTTEGEEILNSQHELEVGGDGEKGNGLLLFWPTTIIHRITPESPLYKYGAEEFSRQNLSFEVIVVLEGIVESTGLVTQARSSYLPSEILWGHRFKSLVPLLAKSKTGERIMDYSSFHETYPVPTAPQSSYQMQTMYSTAAAAAGMALPPEPPAYHKLT